MRENAWKISKLHVICRCFTWLLYIFPCVYVWLITGCSQTFFMITTCISDPILHDYCVCFTNIFHVSQMVMQLLHVFQIFYIIITCFYRHFTHFTHIFLVSIIYLFCYAFYKWHICINLSLLAVHSSTGYIRKYRLFSLLFSICFFMISISDSFLGTTLLINGYQ